MISDQSSFFFDILSVIGHRTSVIQFIYRDQSMEVCHCLNPHDKLMSQKWVRDLANRVKTEAKKHKVIMVGARLKS